MKLVFLVLITLGLVACTNTSERAIASAAGLPSGASGKLTPNGQEQAAALQMGIKIRLDGVSEAQGLPIAKLIEDQMAVFEPCLQDIMGTKGEVLKLHATFKIEKKGVLSGMKVSKMEPPVPGFADCVVKQSAQIDLGRQPRALTGEMTLGTFYGGSKLPGWSK